MMSDGIIVLRKKRAVRFSQLPQRAYIGVVPCLFIALKRNQADQRNCRDFATAEQQVVCISNGKLLCISTAEKGPDGLSGNTLWLEEAAGNWTRDLDRIRRKTFPE